MIQNIFITVIIIATDVADSSSILTNRHFIAFVFDWKFKNEEMVTFEILGKWRHIMWTDSSDIYCTSCSFL